MQVLTAAPSPHRCAQHAQLPTRLPVLSLQQAQPLELTASHPALQSLLIAQAISQSSLVGHVSKVLPLGRVAPAWHWGPNWGGTLALGTALGRPFAEGLLRLCQVERGCLHAERCTLELPANHRPTALRALARMLSACVIGRLSDNRLSDADVNVLALPLIAPDCELVSLDLRANSFGAVGGRALATALLSNGTLEELRIDSDFALPICSLKGLHRGSSISLNLSAQGLGVASVAIISALVAHNTCLLDLSLTGNWRIGAQGGALMAECLESNRTLRMLDMYGCKLGDEGVRPLLRVLMTKPGRCPLHSLELGQNGVSVAVEVELSTALKHHLVALGLRAHRRVTFGVVPSSPRHNLNPRRATRSGTTIVTTNVTTISTTISTPVRRAAPSFDSKCCRCSRVMCGV